jgi:hypothetical protein
MAHDPSIQKLAISQGWLLRPAIQSARGEKTAKMGHSGTFWDIFGGQSPIK